MAIDTSKLSREVRVLKIQVSGFKIIHIDKICFEEIRDLVNSFPLKEVN
jgi:hypothetical protein